MSIQTVNLPKITKEVHVFRFETPITLFRDDVKLVFGDKQEVIEKNVKERLRSIRVVIVTVINNHTIVSLDGDNV
jgi:hypothetical protein